MSEALLILKLFSVFFVIGIFTFGGGYAMLSIIQHQVVSAHGWLSESAFTDIVAISQMTPGPVGINTATYVGYETLREAGASHFIGILGSLSTTFAVVLPSFIIVLLIVRFYAKFKSSPVFAGVMSLIRPAVTGLIGAAALMLIFNSVWSGTPLFSTLKLELLRENFPHWTSWLLFGAALAASLLLKAGPIALILAGGLAGLILY